MLVAGAQSMLLGHANIQHSFIPRAADIQDKPRIEADLTDIPLSPERWKKITQSFYLHGHIVKAIQRKLTSITSIPLKYDDGDDEQDHEVLWMHTAMTNIQGPDTFALASTHFSRANLTVAVMIGCSVAQMRRVESLLRGTERAIGHPLLMLGIYAELQLDRLRKLVKDSGAKCVETTRRLENEAPHDLHDATRKKITWDLINEVRAVRAESKSAEEEVRATKRQLSKALPPAVNKRLNGNENNDEDADAADSPESEINEDVDITNMFLERFADIFTQFEGLTADCRINVEEMSFAADIVGWPLNLITETPKLLTTIRSGVSWQGKRLRSVARRPSSAPPLPL
jgi:hypothetical protein